ncbi:MAG: hypothetical protein ACYC7D_05330 [Nitrososphaerales archaeon]
MPEYTVFIAGEQSITWQSLDFNSSLDLSTGNCTIQFPDSSTMLSSNGVGEDIQIKRDDFLIWRGLGVGYQKTYDSSGAKNYNLICRDTKIYLVRELFQKNGAYYAIYGPTHNVADNEVNACTLTTNLVNNPDSIDNAFDTLSINADNSHVQCHVNAGASSKTYTAGYDLGSSGFDLTYGYSEAKYWFRIKGVIMSNQNCFVHFILIDVNGNYRNYHWPIAMTYTNGLGWSGNPETLEIDVNSYTAQIGAFDITHVRYYGFSVRTPSGWSGSVDLFVSDIRMEIYQPSPTALVIFNDILACQNVATIVEGMMPSSSPHVLTTMNNFKAMQALQQLIQTVVYELRFNPDLTVDFLTQVGSDLSATINFATSLNSEKTEWDYSIENIVNDVVVAGSSANQLQVTVDSNDVVSIASSGRWSNIYNFPNVYDTTLLTSYANAVLNDMIVPTDTYKATVWDNNVGVGFQVGDTVSISDKVLGDNAPYRIFSIHRHYDSSNFEQVEIVFVKNYRQVNVNNWKVQQLQTVLNAWAASVQNLQNNVTTGAPPTAPANPQTGSNTFLPSNNTSSVEWRVGTAAVQDESGTVQNEVISITITGQNGSTITLSDIYILDMTTMEILLHQTNPVSGTQYQVTTTQDRLGHTLYMVVPSVSNTSGSQASITANWSILCNMSASS